jgi:tetratricopeptide (TPR) repeat protein
LTQAGQLIATKGYGVEPVGKAYREALCLSAVLGDTKSLLRAQLGMEAFYFLRGDFAQAEHWIALAQQTAQGFDDALTAVQCQWAVANIAFHQGDVADALQRMDACVARCQREALGTTWSAKLVQSPEVMCQMYSAYCLWTLGQPEQGLQRVADAVRLAQSLKHRLGIGQALGMQAMIELVSGHTARAFHTSEQAVAVCEEGDHDMWGAHARFILGCAMAGLGEREAGLAMMDAADTLWAATGAMLTRSFYLTLRAQVNAELGHADTAWSLIEEASHIVAHFGERYFEPEVLRVRGELCLARGEHQAAKTCFDTALAVAQARGMLSLSQRVQTSLAALSPPAPPTVNKPPPKRRQSAISKRPSA